MLTRLLSFLLKKLCQSDKTENVTQEQKIVVIVNIDNNNNKT